MGPRPTPQYDKARVEAALANLWSILVRAGAPEQMTKDVERLQKQCGEFFDSITV